MSKADDLRKKMGSREAVFTPRASVSVQPIQQPKEATKPAVNITEKPEPKQPAKKSVPKKDESVVLFARISKEDKRWLDHRRIDEGKELGELVTEAIRLLKKQSEKA